MYQVRVVPQECTPVVSQPAEGQSSGRSVQKYKNIVFGLGITEIVLGLVSWGCAIAALILSGLSFAFSYYSTLGTGIWCGVPLIVCGVFGVVAKFYSKTSLFFANIVLSIFSSILMIVLATLSCLAATWDEFGAATTLNGILAAIGFAGFFITIIHTVYCSAGVCRTSSVESTMIYLPQEQMNHAVSTNGQIIAHHAQPCQNFQNVYVSSVPTPMPQQIGIIANSNGQLLSNQAAFNADTTSDLSRVPVPLPGNYDKGNSAATSDGIPAYQQ